MERIRMHKPHMENMQGKMEFPTYTQAQVHDGDVATSAKALLCKKKIVSYDSC